MGFRSPLEDPKGYPRAVIDQLSAEDPRQAGLNLLLNSGRLRALTVAAIEPAPR